MIPEMLEMSIKRWKWLRYRHALERMTTMDQFTSLMEQLQDSMFKDYAQWDLIGPRRHEIDSVLQALGVDVCGKSFFDIGPGFGSTLDVVRERGATCVEFAEYNPFFYTYNRLKGFTGYPFDVRKDLTRLALRRYDFIWIKQTFVADRFVSQDLVYIARITSRYPKLEVLLAQLESLAAAGGVILFCPHWTSRNGKRLISDVLRTPLYHIFHQHGYETLPCVKGHNIEPVSPVTFYKRVPGIKSEGA